MGRKRRHLDPSVRRNITDRSLVEFNFKKFMKDFNLTFEGFMMASGYSESGTYKALKRGSLKLKYVERLEFIYKKDLKKYWREVK